MGKAIDLTGMKFGRLTVLERDMTKPIGHQKPVYWVCQCECGKIKVVRGANLKNGHTQSCGCLRIENLRDTTRENLAGQIFGKLTVLEIDKNKQDSSWLCRCECGKITSVLTENLKKGRTKSCGCHRISKGELVIKEILIKNNINFCEQFTFNDLKGDKRVLKFDFGIFNEKNELSYLIEYNGIQHYEPIKHFGGTSKFQKQQRYDLRKQEYCSIKNIPLIIINYNQEITEETIIRKEYL